MDFTQTIQNTTVLRGVLILSIFLSDYTFAKIREMPGINGLQIANLIQNKPEKCPELTGCRLPT